MKSGGVQFWDESKTSTVLDIPRGTLANMRSQRRGPPYCKIGRMVRYKSEDVLAWAEQVRIVPEDGPAPPGGRAKKRAAG